MLWVWRQALSTMAPRRRSLTKPRIRQKRGPDMLRNVWNDVRYAIRSIRRNPGFTAAAIVPIALGIGINTGIFSILNGLALRPLPAPDANELVSVYQQMRGGQHRMRARLPQHVLDA